MGTNNALHLLDGYGIEVEYMIVRQEGLDILPVADQVIRAASGRYDNEVEFGVMGWSNELVKHVIEIRNSAPVSSLGGIAQTYQDEVDRINRILKPMGGRLMPASMHPWMDPASEAVLWDREYGEVYRTYDRIFGCRTHGWANIQSAQINISFSGSEEFGRLHAALRLVLPLIPAIAASSPVYGGAATGIMDNRLTFYSRTQKEVPSIAGEIIPERVYSIEEYRKNILESIYVDIAPHDPEGILQHEWLNSRGAIPRYDRSAIEIRLPDIQECPRSDMAVMSAIRTATRTICDEKWSPFGMQKEWETARLKNILDRTTKDAEHAVIDDTEFIGMFGINKKRVKAGEVWDAVIEASGAGDIDEDQRAVLGFIRQKGTLSRRILRALGKHLSKEKLREVYGMLCDCLERGELFDA